MSDSYAAYIASDKWRRKRIERLEIDDYKCVVCKGNGTEYRLEVHHLHYDSFQDENPLLDLVTACSRCHPYLDDVRKARTNAKRTHEPSFVSVEASTRMENQNGMAGIALQVDVIGPIDNAQRADGRSVEQVGARFEEDFIQARQDRR